MALILAIDLERRQAGALERLGRELPGHELLVAPSCADALAACAHRAPDLVLVSLLLPDAQEQQFHSDLRARFGGSDVRTLTIPLLVSPNQTSPDACEPRVFADHIRAYLGSEAVAAPPPPPPDSRKRSQLLAAAQAAAAWARKRREQRLNQDAASEPPPPPPLIAAPVPPPQPAPVFVAPPPAVAAPPPRPPVAAPPPPPPAAAPSPAVMAPSPIVPVAPPKPVPPPRPIAPPAPVAPVAPPAPPAPLAPPEPFEPLEPDEPLEPVDPLPPSPSLAERAADFGREFRESAAPWLPRIAALIALIAVGLIGRAYWSPANALLQEGLAKGTAVFDSAKATLASDPAAPGPAKAAPVAASSRASAPGKRTGTLHVVSNPAEARVLVDGAFKGLTPLTLQNVTAGSYTVSIEGPDGTVKKTVKVVAGETVDVDESLFAGFVGVYAPFEIAVTEGGRSLRLDDRNQVLLPPGTHTLHFINRALAFNESREVEVKPGALTRLTVTPARSTLIVNAAPGGEVWLDGARVGETPLASYPVEIGSHDVVLKRPGAPDRHFPITMTTKPLTLNADPQSP